MIKINYPYLPAGWEIRYVGADHPHMLAARQARLDLSTDHYHPTGAVVVWGGQIIAREANQSALRHPRLIRWHHGGVCVRRWLKIKSGEKYWLCPGCSSSRHHAESRAARAAQMTGLDLSGAALYLWGHWWCCAPCWSAIIEAGIGEVYLLEGSTVLFNRNHPENKIGQ